MKHPRLYVAEFRVRYNSHLTAAIFGKYLRMLKLRKPLLPEWRYWPAVPLVALLMLCVAGSSLPPISQKEVQTQAQVCHIAQAIGTTIATHETADDRIADYTWWLMAFTGVLGLASIFQAFFLIRADRLTRSSIDLARQEFVVGQRPWVDIQVTNVALCLKDGMIHAQIEMRAENVGKTPATKVHCSAELIDCSGPITDFGQISNRFFADQLTRAANDTFGGFNILPGHAITDSELTHTNPNGPTISELSVQHVAIAICATYSYLDGLHIGQTGCVCHLRQIQRPGSFTLFPRLNWTAFAETDDGRWCTRVT